MAQLSSGHLHGDQQGPLRPGDSSGVMPSASSSPAASPPSPVLPSASPLTSPTSPTAATMNRLRKTSNMSGVPQSVLLKASLSAQQMKLHQLQQQGSSDSSSSSNGGGGGGGGGGGSPTAVHRGFHTHHRKTELSHDVIAGRGRLTFRSDSHMSEKAERSLSLESTSGATRSNALKAHAQGHLPSLQHHALANPEPGDVVKDATGGSRSPLLQKQGDLGVVYKSGLLNSGSDEHGRGRHKGSNGTTMFADTASPATVVAEVPLTPAGGTAVARCLGDGSSTSFGDVGDGGSRRRSLKGEDGRWRSPSIEVMQAEVTAPLGALRHSTYSPSSRRMVDVSPAAADRRLTQTSLSPPRRRFETDSPSNESVERDESTGSGIDNGDDGGGDDEVSMGMSRTGGLAEVSELGRRARPVFAVKGVDGETERWMRRHHLLKEEHFTLKQRQELLELFHAIDTDHSGCISVEELADPLLAMGIARNLHEVAHLVKSSSSHSGTKEEIDLEDFIRLLRPFVTAAAHPRRSLSHSPIRRRQESNSSTDSTESGGPRSSSVTRVRGVSMTSRPREQAAFYKPRKHRVEPLSADELGTARHPRTSNIATLTTGVGAAERNHSGTGGPGMDAASRTWSPHLDDTNLEHPMALLLETAHSTGEQGLHTAVDLQRRQLLMEAVVYAPQRREAEWADLELLHNEAITAKDEKKERSVNQRLKEIDTERRELNVVLSSVEQIANF